MDKFFLTEQGLKGLLGTVGLVVVSLGLTVLLVLFPPYLPFLLVFAVIWLLLIPRWPFLGLIGYVLVVLLRPGEVYSIPFVAKAAAGSCLLVLLISIAQQKRFPQVTSAYKAMLFFVAAVAVSAISAFWMEQVLETWQNTLKLLLLYTLIISFVSTKRQLGVLGVTILAAVGYAGLHVIYQIMTGSASSGERIHNLAWGMFGDSNEFAQIVTMLIPVLVPLLIEMKGLIWRGFYSAMIGIGMTIIILSGSRGGFLGLLVVIVALTWRSSRRLMLSTIVVLTFGTAMVLAPASYFERLGSITNHSQDESASDRIEAWKAGFRMVLRNPVTGIGAGCFEEASMDYGLSHGLVAHNSFVTVLAETGLVGLAAYLLLIFYTFRGCRQIASNLKVLGQQQGLLHILAQALPISMMGYIVTAMFISTTYYPQLFILSAMVSAGVNMTNRWTNEQPATVQPGIVPTEVK